MLVDVKSNRMLVPKVIACDHWLKKLLVVFRRKGPDNKLPVVLPNACPEFSVPLVENLLTTISFVPGEPSKKSNTIKPEVPVKDVVLITTVKGSVAAAVVANQSAAAAPKKYLNNLMLAFLASSGVI